MVIRARRQELAIDGVGRLYWKQVLMDVEVDPEKSALIICDAWDRHWSKGATERLEALVPGIDRLARRAREAGFLVVHAPSETIEHYEGTPARQRIEAVPLETLEEGPPVDYPPLPIDDSDGGSDTNHDGSEKVDERAWSMQHPGIEIDHDVDVISDIGLEIASYFKHEGIDTVFTCGVHANMCILERGFGLKQMLRWGFRDFLVRDLTDAMYNPARRPYVSHDEGTALVVGYIEKFVCPTVHSAGFTLGR